MRRGSWLLQAFGVAPKGEIKSASGRQRRKSRELKRRVLLEQLEPRHLLAGDNTPPTASGGWIDLQQATPHVIAVQDLGYSDADSDPIVSLTVQALPSLGALQLNGYSVNAGQEIGVSEIIAGQFAYVPATTLQNSYSATFSFSVSDGLDSSSGLSTLGFHVAATPNSPPTVTGSSHQLAPSVSHTVTAAALGYSDPEGDALQWITILNPPTSGTLEYYG
jgi:hypothetical protein